MRGDGSGMGLTTGRCVLTNDNLRKSVLKSLFMRKKCHFCGCMGAAVDEIKNSHSKYQPN